MFVSFLNKNPPSRDRPGGISRMEADRGLKSAIAAGASVVAAAIIVTCVGVHAGVCVILADLTEDVRSLRLIADLGLCIRQGGSQPVNVVGLNQVTGDLVLGDICPCWKFWYCPMAFWNCWAICSTEGDG